MQDLTNRRRFLKLSAAASFSGVFLPRVSRGAEGIDLIYQRIVPARKGLDGAWALSLLKKEAPLDAGISASAKDELSRIGMTVGGIGCGTVYLSGDGRLYVWDIFNQPHQGVVANKVPTPAGLENIAGAGKLVREADGANYLSPPTADNRPNHFAQGFSLLIDGDAIPRALDSTGWDNVKFTGRWPLGIVEYSHRSSPVSVKLEAWTPFIPLSTDDSSLPVTVMEYTVENHSDKVVKGSLVGLLENPVLVHSRRQRDARINSRILNEHGRTLLFHESTETKFEKNADFGTAVLMLLGVAKESESTDRLIKSFEIQPGGVETIRFVIAWHFPNLGNLPGVGKQTPLHTSRFKDAAAVATHLAERFNDLRAATMKWVSTWNDSTLPQWLLDRSILTTNTIQTTNCHVFANRRFWAWEGIGCCAGTCGHVWHYAQGVARLFPELERNLREVTDYGVAMNPDGSIRFRAEAQKTVAIDSQTGVILRTWREHLVSTDDSFLKRVWPAAKHALEWLIRFDESGSGGLDGLLDGRQHNTLDAEWYGKVHCLCSLYLASLLAGQKMALAMDDREFASRCEKIHEVGAAKISSLFNGEFYIQEEDPKHPDAIGVGKGCYIDQVIGQWWASQTGLGRIYDRENIRTALASLWRYNFVPEIGSFRQIFTLGRFYAMPGEAGLVMCTWPKGGLRDDFKKHWQYAYFNECMSGFEWQAAAHMLQEGAPISGEDFASAGELLEKTDDLRSFTVRGLAVGRAVHDRYHPSKRNPYNEIECSDHYARANASYSLFLAACGFSYDGPAGIIGFDPKIAPENFKSAFTAAEGWGTFQQEFIRGKGWRASIRIAHGTLKLSEIRLPWLNSAAKAASGGNSMTASAQDGSIRFDQKIEIVAGGDGVSIDLDV